MSAERGMHEPVPVRASVRYPPARTFGIAVVAATAAIAGLVGFLSSDHEKSFVRAFGGAAILVGAVLAVLACGYAARRPGPDSRGWTLLAISVAAWGAGELYWITYSILVHPVYPAPLIADIGFLGSGVPALAAMLSFRRQPMQLLTRLRSVVDSLLIASSTLFTAWVTVLGPVYRASSGGRFSRDTGLSHPVLDAALASIFVVLAIRQPMAARLPWALIASGYLALTVTDSTALSMHMHGVSGLNGTVVAVGWVAAFLLIALGAIAPTRRTAPGPARVLTLTQEILPYVPVTVALLVASYVKVFDDPVLVGLGGAVLVFVAIRQVMIINEKRAWAEDLQQRVDLRSEELLHVQGDLQRAFDTAAIGMVWAEMTGEIFRVNSVFCRMLGRSKAELVGSSVWDIVIAADVSASQLIFAHAAAGEVSVARMDTRYRHADGNDVWADVSLLVTSDAIGRPKYVVSQVQDVTERRTAEAALKRQALHDPLTDLANRALLRDRLEHAIARQLRQPDPLALLLLDLDGFKLVNDSLGHQAGDDVLITLGNRLRAKLRPEDTIARLGGDEFAVVLENTTEAQATAIANQILSVVRMPMNIHGRSITSDASIGITISTGADAPEDLLRNADLAMYAAKDRGKGAVQVFRASMHETVLHRLTLDAELREAVGKRQFSLVYQPIVSLVTGNLTGFEALIRWNHPVRGVVMPAEFIPLVEANGLIVPIGQWVLREACRQVSQWRRLHPELCISVNLSVRQLQDPVMVAVVEGALTNAGLPASHLQLEITESIFDRRGETLAVVDRLHATGVQLAIDDFGTGYSSLSRLHLLPIDKVKIDKSFVDLLAGGKSAPMVTATIAMAHSLGLQTVAEGVESTDQLVQLRLHHCDDAQGYLFGRPVSASAVDALLHERGTGVKWTTVEIAPVAIPAVERRG